MFKEYLIDINMCINVIPPFSSSPLSFIFCTVVVGSFCIFHIRCGLAFLFSEQYVCKAKMDRKKKRLN